MSSLVFWNPLEFILKYSGSNKKCILEKHCLKQKYFSNGKSFLVKITSSLPFEQTIKFTLKKCPADSVLVATLVPLFLLIAGIVAFVVLFKKYPKLFSKDDPESRIQLMNMIRIEVINPRTNEVKNEKYTDYEVRLANSFHDNESGVRKRFEDFKSLRDQLEIDGKTELPTLPNQSNTDDNIFEEDYIENQRSELEEFINKIYKSFALTEKCVQMFIHKSSIDKRMRGQFQTDMKACEGFTELLEKLGIKPNRVRNTNEKCPKHTQTINVNEESGILIQTNPNPELWIGWFHGWVVCSNPPSFQLGIPFKETTIYGRDTTTTATIDNKKLIKTQIPDGSNQPTTVETREMMGNDTMKMQLAIKDQEIKCEFIYTRLSAEENFDQTEEASLLV